MRGQYYYAITVIANINQLSRRNHCTPAATSAKHNNFCQRHRRTSDQIEQRHTGRHWTYVVDAG